MDHDPSHDTTQQSSHRACPPHQHNLASPSSGGPQSPRPGASHQDNAPTCNIRINYAALCIHMFSPGVLGCGEYKVSGTKLSQPSQPVNQSEISIVLCQPIREEHNYLLTNQGLEDYFVNQSEMSFYLSNCGVSMMAWQTG